MANTLTGLLTTITRALGDVSAEQIGLLNLVNRNASLDQVAKDQVIRIPIVPVATAADITPGVTPPDAGDQTIDYTDVSMTKFRHVPIRWTGEETKGLQNSGSYDDITAKRFQQAFRTLRNEVEADLAALHIYASRAYGTAGTTPFGTANDLTDFTRAAQILKDNGATPTYKMGLGNDAEAVLKGKQSALWKVNESGTRELLDKGLLNKLMGFDIGFSGSIATHTKGSGSGYLINNGGGYAIGATSLTLDTGSGTILAGDVITIGSYKYVVKTALAANVVVIQNPGLRAAVANNDAVTVNDSSSRNLVFGDNTIYLASRAPAMPAMGDASEPPQYVTDPYTNLTYEITHYGQFRQATSFVSLAWGPKVVVPEHVGILLG